MGRQRPSQTRQERWLVGGPGPPLWKMMEFVNWDDEIPKISGKIRNVKKKHQPEDGPWSTHFSWLTLRYPWKKHTAYHIVSTLDPHIFISFGHGPSKRSPFTSLLPRPPKWTLDRYMYRPDGMAHLAPPGYHFPRNAPEKRWDTRALDLSVDHVTCTRP